LEVDVDKKKRNSLRNLRQKVAKLELEPPRRGRSKKYRRKQERARQELIRYYQLKATGGAA